jgi:hypothetical protein
MLDLSSFRDVLAERARMYEEQERPKETPLGTHALSQLRDAFINSSDLPMRVDVCDGHELSPNFQKIVEADGQAFLFAAPTAPEK